MSIVARTPPPAVTSIAADYKPPALHSPAGMPRRPKISIMLITYNHEKYIAQALESILMQETEYDYEINVIEDCSTDKTQEVVMRYVQKYPDIVKPYFNKKNIGHKVTQKNFYRGFKTLTGDYFAILEGDDYWSSPHKLQKQVSFLEAHPDFVACAHNTVKMYEDGSKEPHRFLYWEKRRDSTIEDAIHLRSFFHTTGLMYRNVFKGVPPRQYRNKWSCDIFIYISHAQFGKIHHFDEDMAVYRAQACGRFSNMPLLDGWFFNIGGLRRYNEWLGYRYLKTFSGSIARYCHVVLSESGGGEAAPLTWYQFVKYLGLWACYRSIYEVLDLPSQVKATLPHLSRDMSSARRMLLQTYCVFLFLIYPLCLIMNALFAVSYRLIVALTPNSVINAIRNFEASHAGVRHLRFLLHTGHLFTAEGARHCVALARRAVFKARNRIKRHA